MQQVVERRGVVLATEKTASGERFPKHDRHREDVGLSCDLPADLLGRELADLSLELAVTRGLDAACRLRDAEVDDARDAVRANQDVLRRYVAVDDAEHLTSRAARFMRRMETAQGPGNDGENHLGRQALTAFARGSDEARQRVAVHVVHDEE